MHNIKVKEPVPEHFSELVSMDSWSLIARHTAFEAVLQKIEPRQAFTVKFALSELREPSSSGNGQQLSIVCDLQLTIESFHA